MTKQNKAPKRITVAYKTDDPGHLNMCFISGDISVLHIAKPASRGFEVLVKNGGAEFDMRATNEGADFEFGNVKALNIGIHGPRQLKGFLDAWLDIAEQLKDELRQYDRRLS